MPNSTGKVTSVPEPTTVLMVPAHTPATATRTPCQNVTAPPSRPRLQVLPGVAHGVDRATGLGALAAGDQRADVDDPLALLAGDPRPVVRVRGVRQVLVLAELVDARGEQMLHAQAALTGREQVLDCHLLAAVDDVLDHRAGVEVLEVQRFLVAVGVGDLEEAVLLRLGV